MTASAAIFSNEILPNPLGADLGVDEKVEIYNSGPDAVDLTGWAIDDAVTISTTAVRARIPEDFDAGCSTNPIIQPGEFRVVHINGAAGRRVAALLNGPLAAGTHSIDWTGRDDFGLTSPAGIYFLRISAGERRAVQKVLLLK